jgi:hypothetical protein
VCSALPAPCGDAAPLAELRFPDSPIMRIKVLDWHQEPNDRARTFLSEPDALRLVGRLAAEHIRSGTIRMFAPDSVFYALRPVAPQVRLIPTKLPPVEVENCKFQRAKSDPRPSLASVVDGWDRSLEPDPIWVRHLQTEQALAG